jgi:site-specific recombinase XerD
MSHPSRVRVSGPLESYALGFAAELSRLGYRSVSATFQLQLMAHLSRWLSGETLDSRRLSPGVVDRFLDARRGAGYTNYLSSKAMQPMLEYLRRLGVALSPIPQVAEGPLEVCLERYRRYLTVERGLATKTIRGYVDAVQPFLCGRVSADGLDLERLTASEIAAFVVARCRNQAPGSAKLMVTALRSLLNFLHVDAMLDRSLAVSVPSVASWRLSGLPKGLEPIQVRSLLASCDQRTTKGCRDFAILTVLVRLGLRAGELAGLQLEDFVWRAGEVIVRGKGNRTERLPLPADVGEAVAAYLRRGRPESVEGRTVFVRARAPLWALTASGVTSVVTAAGRRTGLGQISAHRLRHTAATQMLRAGAPMAEIGQVLRHRRALSTSIYAKVDRERLRSLARPWPGGAA